MSDDKNPKITRDTIYSLRSENLPMGRLSGINFGKISFQVQTEFTLYPNPIIQTLIILGGEIKRKIENEVDIDQDRETLTKLLNEQHIQSINDLKNKAEKKFRKSE